MGLLFSDSFNSYAQTSDFTAKWATITTWAYNATAGRNGGVGVTLTAAQGTLKTNQAAFAVQPLCAGFWFKATAAPAASTYILKFQDSANNDLGGLGITTSGFAQLLNFLGNNIATGSRSICDGNWHWIELYFGAQGSATNKCSVDTVSQWNGAFSPVASPTSIDHAIFTNGSNLTCNLSWPMFWDNSSGAPQLADFPLGPREMTTSRPASDGTCTFGTLSTGSNHSALVNETVADGNTSYVQDGTSGHQDLYNIAALGVSPTSITTVVLNASVENPNSGTINHQQVIKSSSTTTSGTSTVTPTSYTTLQQSFPTDPNTSAAWASASAINAAQIGIKVV